MRKAQPYDPFSHPSVIFITDLLVVADGMDRCSRAGCVVVMAMVIVMVTVVAKVTVMVIHNVL